MAEPVADPSGSSSEPVWTYRGYQIKAGEFTSAMVHLFRAEVSRANIWRARLDNTTNWAVVATGAAISLAFTSADAVNHFVIIVNTLLVTLFLCIETRRYRYYELWSYRVRLMETDFFSSMLVPPFRPAPDWAESLAESLLHPNFPVSFWEAFGRRYRLNYIWIFGVLLLSWFFKVAYYPAPIHGMQHFLERAAIGDIPGEVVLAAGLVFHLALLGVGLATMGMHEASGEVLPRYGALAEQSLHGGLDKVRAWFRPSKLRQQALVVIVTAHPEDVGRTIIKEMNRGVTAVSGKGLYTGRTRAVLMTALTVTEIPHLKEVVAAADPDAFVVISPAREILGSGFMPLHEEEHAEPT